MYVLSESTLLACMATSASSQASVIIYNQSESTLLARMATSASPSASAIMYVSVGEHPACSCMANSPSSRPPSIIYKSVGEHPACTYGELGFSCRSSVIIYMSVGEHGDLILQPGLLLGDCNHLQVSRRAPYFHVWRPRLLLGLREHLQSVGEHPACTYADFRFSSGSAIMYVLSESTLLACMATSPSSSWSSTISRRAPCLHVCRSPLLLDLRDHVCVIWEHPACIVWRPRLLVGLRDHLQSVGEHPACTYGDLGFSISLRDHVRVSRRAPCLLTWRPNFATWASPWPPCNHLQVIRRAPCLLTWRPNFATSGFSMASVIMYSQSESTLLASYGNLDLLLGLRDHLQSVGEHPTCTYGDLGFFSVSDPVRVIGEHPACIIYLRDHLQSGEHPACTYGDLGFFSASVIMYSQSESTLLTRMVQPRASPWPPWSSTISRRAPCLHVWPISASPRPPRSCTCYRRAPCLHVWLISTSSRSPWSSTISRRAPCLHVWRPRLLHGLRDHVQSVGEHPAGTYATLASPRPLQSSTC